MEEQTKILNKVIGKEIEKLESKEVIIKKIDLKDFEEMNDKLIFSCKHPDKEELLNISKASVKKNDKIKTSGLWFSLDKENNIAYESTLAEFMRFHKVNSVYDLLEKSLMTEKDSNGYLVFKAY